MAIKTNNDLTPEEATKHEAQWGGYNDFPPGWRRLTKKEFAQSAYFTYGPEMLEYRQMIAPGQPAVSTHLHFLHDGTGYAIVADYWKGGVEFFTFGCDHEYEPTDIGRPLFRCEHASKCKKCGHVFVVDSSD